MTNYFIYLKKNFSISNILMLFFIIYLPIFSFVIFAPTEIFFANHAAFGVIFAEFGWKFLKYGTLLAATLTLITLFLPRLIQKFILSVLWIISIGGYIQTMFLNKHLDQIGATTDGYIPATDVVIKNFLIWAVIITVSIFVIIKSKENWKKPLFLISLILVLTQGVAYGTLFLSAPTESLEYVESKYYLSGEKQYTVSSESNVIVFILDSVSNWNYDITLQEYPELYGYFPDFTFYSNADCNYYGTYPSLARLITGHVYDHTLSVNDWIYECWTNDATTQYYDSLHEAGYDINVYAVEPQLFTTSHTLSLTEGKIDNLTSQASERQINYDSLYKTLLEMACYRFMPDYFKPIFDVPNTQYATIVTYPDNKINYMNTDFYADLCTKGLSVNTEEKYVTLYHLNGCHELINDENCVRVENSSVANTMKGIWKMLSEYLMQLQDLGVYDNSTIIITSDHGAIAHPQPVFFIKEANERHEQMQITNAPITLNELVPTIAQIVTGESDYLGQTIYDFSQNELRERTLYVRDRDDNFPSVPRYDGTPSPNGANAYRLYTYTGNYDNYLELYWNDIFITVPMVDSYF